MRYLLGLVGFTLGLVIVVKREPIKRAIGDIAAFEKYFGPGGTYTGLLLMGLLLSFLSIMFAFGTLQSLISSIFGPFFG
ncbi:hypothetical protein CO046_02920 [Candidatus Peregrinibacteria bacterium CG_4_9_14_0_2_um_filter_53_11]|nr:MAG: hypothetical protein CO046_02920 [Candidatus Peregrinibacteria bacterium CG_4_9_14_0_2_um_filter_53_11]